MNRTALDDAQELIRFATPSRVSNVEISEQVRRRLAELGFETEWIEYTDPQGVRKANVVGRKGPGSGGMAWFGHTDVVPAETWSLTEHGPFEPTVRDGKLYGRGSCDMKGSLACMLAAVSRIPADALRQPVYVTCTADEEVGYLGAAEVVRRSRFYREMVDHESHGVIGEPTLLDVVYAHKGTYGFIATSHGRAAHSSTREGRNANLAMIPFLVEMKRIHDETETDPRWQDPEFDPPTICWNIGINDHTQAINITAPQSICTVYYRPMPGQDAEALMERARRAAEACGLDFEARYRGQPLYVDPKSQFVQEALRLVGQSQPRTVPYGTDGAMFTAMRRILVLGPGDIKQAHTDDEWIALDQLDQGTDIYERLIRHWCREQRA